MSFITYLHVVLSAVIPTKITAIGIGRICVPATDMMVPTTCSSGGANTIRPMVTTIRSHASLTAVWPIHTSIPGTVERPALSVTVKCVREFVTHLR